jgi:PAS domain S-box-containing protein
MTTPPPAQASATQHTPDLPPQADGVPREQEAHSAPLGVGLSAAEIQRRLDDARSRQVELEAQHEELLRTQSALRESMVIAGLGSYVLDIASGIWQGSDLLNEIFGIDPTYPHTIHMWLPLIHPEDRPMMELYFFTDVLGHGQAFDKEYRIIRRNDQTERWVHCRGKLEFDAHGAPVRMLGTVHDITYRKQMENVQLFLLQSGYTRAGEDFFRSLARYLSHNLSMEYVCIDRLIGDGLEAKTMSTYHDGTFDDGITYSLLDSPCGDVVGKSICCFPNDVRQLFPKDGFLHALQAVSYVGTTLWSFDGKPIGLIALIGRKPLTNPALAESMLKLVGLRAAAELERRQAEKDRLQILMNLEHMVQQRTLELKETNRMLLTEIAQRSKTEQEVALQRSELAHLSRVSMLGELSGSLAHELSQPLTAILCNVHAAQHMLAKEGMTDPIEMQEILADIESEDKRAGEIIRRLHLLLKKGNVQKQPLEFNDVVLEVLNILRNDLANHNVTVETQLTPGPTTICGDRIQLQQVLLNLVMNACDAMAGNETHNRLLTIHTRIASDTEVRVEVSDNGHGLPDGSEDQAFARFFTTKPHGLGLGLAVCRTIINAHNGTLGAANNRDGGATFHCTLPANPP